MFDSKWAWNSTNQEATFFLRKIFSKIPAFFHEITVENTQFAFSTYGAGDSP
jgi:hypothetical protein